jgi:hypothetical protein
LATATNTLTPSNPGGGLITSQIPYPNPVKGNQVTFSYTLSQNADNVSFKLFSVAFRKVAQFNSPTQAGDNTVSFDLSNFANGLYYYMIEAKAGTQKQSVVGKLLVEK